MKRLAFSLAVLLALATPVVRAQRPAHAQRPATTRSFADDAELSRGSQLLQARMFEAAAAEFKKAITAAPKDPRAHFQYAVSLFSLGHNNQARGEFERVRALAGNTPYVTYYLGRLDLLANNYPAAIRRLDSIALHPPLPDTDFYLGAAYLSSGNVNKGVEWLERAARLQPTDYRVHYRLARAYSMAGRRQEAAREYSLYSKLLNQHKDTEADVRACSEALRTKSSDEAHAICQRIYDPNDAERLTLLGQLYGDAGDFQFAVDPLKRAVELDPKSFEALHDLGLTYFRLKQYENARVPLEQAARMHPESYGTVVMLGATLYMLGDDKAALPVLEHAHQLNPNDAQTAAVLDRLRAEQQKK